jgi:hypothetical protein
MRKRDIRPISVRPDPAIREILEQKAKEDKRSVASLIEKFVEERMRELGWLPREPRE